MKWVWTLGAFAATNLATASVGPTKYVKGEPLVSGKGAARLAIGLGVAYLVYTRVK